MLLQYTQQYDWWEVNQSGRTSQIHDNWSQRVFCSITLSLSILNISRPGGLTALKTDASKSGLVGFTRGGWTSVLRNIAQHSCDEKELIDGLPLK